MTMITMMKIMLKIKIIKDILKIEFMLMIVLNSKTYIQNLQGKKQTKILIYYIQTIKRLPCLICSVNFTFIKTKRGMSLI